MGCDEILEEVRMLKGRLTLGRTTLPARGVVGVIFGVLAMAWPDETVVVLVVLWGCWALVDGVMAIGFAGVAQGTGATLAAVVLGVFSLVAAFFTFVWVLIFVAVAWGVLKTTETLTTANATDAALG
jgi:uncharacterized membrane protein HdeD (DUF308 family)